QRRPVASPLFPYTTLFRSHWLGVMGMQRRIPVYLPEPDFVILNQISTISSFVLAASTLPFLWNVYKTWRHGALVKLDDPWGFGKDRKSTRLNSSHVKSSYA